MVVNPAAGQKAPELTIAKTREALAELGMGCEIHKTEGAGDAARWAARTADLDFDLLVVVGGDGTLAEAAGGLVNSGASVPLLFVPRGTANLITMATGIPRDLKKAVHLLRSGVVHRFDIGYLPRLDRFFLLTLAIGFPAETVEEAPRSLKDKLGVGAYMWGAARKMWRPHAARFELVLDGIERQSISHVALVSNVGSIRTIGFKVGPNASPDDGKLDVYIDEGESSFDLLNAVLEFLAGKGEGRNVSHFTASRAKITTDPVLRVQADGEVLGDTPVEVEIRRRALPLVVPSAYPPAGAQ